MARGRRDAKHLCLLHIEWITSVYTANVNHSGTHLIHSTDPNETGRWRMVMHPFILEWDQLWNCSML